MVAASCQLQGTLPSFADFPGPCQILLQIVPLFHYPHLNVPCFLLEQLIIFFLFAKYIFVKKELPLGNISNVDIFAPFFYSNVVN